MYLPRASSILRYSKFSNLVKAVYRTLPELTRKFFFFPPASLTPATASALWSPAARAPCTFVFFSGEKGAAETDAQKAVVLRFPLHFHTVFLEQGVPSIHSPPNSSFRTSSTNSQ